MRHFLPNGEELIIRPPVITDAIGLLRNFQRMTQETDYLLFTPGEALEMTERSEEDYIRTYLDNPNQLMLVAIVNDTLVGSVTVNHSGYQKKAHIAEMGIAVERAWGSLGIGRRLMTAMLRWAEQHEKIQLIHLQVFGNNDKAMHLYRNFGFLECGRLPNGIQQKDGQYIDLVTMYRRVKP
ncbi:GNAT family N-acetyltransferase [Chitinophaga qingshengii]|uniref:GNAT family N-acetyltransferase n=1 Tax=Chitinophaga qingshengii TaxID=1569794 RepID=A0ABR7TL18_9BACT|nr:GNAT family N-acetyltransferase [Chitinophaga qingshengii]MBC9931159.1 GNAT family N-acetyltransferase [Chitinophaga qingshengii]